MLCSLVLALARVRAAAAAGEVSISVPGRQIFGAAQRAPIVKAVD
jgi:hypothetical protein